MESHLAIIWVESVRFDKRCRLKRSSLKTTYLADAEALASIGNTINQTLSNFLVTEESD